VRVGVPGAGAWARGARLPGYRRDPRCRIIGITDTLVDRAREAAREFDIPHATADPMEVIRRDDIDLIDVCTPSHTHFELAWSALEPGKHLLCEKPVAYDYRDTQRARDLARRKSLKTKPLSQPFVWRRERAAFPRGACCSSTSPTPSREASTRCSWRC